MKAIKQYVVCINNLDTNEIYEVKRYGCDSGIEAITSALWHAYDNCIFPDISRCNIVSKELDTIYIAE